MSHIQKIKDKIKAGKLIKGFFLNMTDPTVSEMAGYAGYDYVWIDAEHGPLDRQEILRHIVSAQSSGCCAFIRVPQVDAGNLKAILDMGPDGIIFPMINTKELAEAAIQATNYPEHGGIRGQGPIRAIKYGFQNEGDYIKNAYQNIFKVLQIETMEAYDNLDEIMSVEGIDSLFVGAADLERSLISRDKNSDRLPEIYDEICQRITDKNITLGSVIGIDPASAKAAVDKGIQFAVFGQDTRILAEGLKRNLNSLKDF